jgi:hypothetical protein
VNFEALVKHGTIDREDLSLFRFAESPAEALTILQAGIQAEGAPEAPDIAHSRTRHDPAGPTRG